MTEIKAWKYVWRVTPEELQRRKDAGLDDDDNHSCASTNTCEWAILTLTEDGMFACVSDYGNYIYYWPAGHRAKGEGIREFVLDVHYDYLLGKTCKKEDVHQKWTKEALRLRVKALRECHNKWLKAPKDRWGCTPTEWCDHGDYQHLDHELHTAEWAKECLDIIDGYLDKNDLNELYHRLDLYFDGEDISYTYSPQALTFGKFVLPQLQRMIKEELEAEKALLSKAG